METTRTGAARIKIEDAVLLFYLWMMAMSVDHCTESGGLWLQIESGEIVEHVDRYASDFDYFRCGQRARPWFSVDVAANRGHRRDVCERFEDFRSADVSRVKNAVGSAQGLHGLGPQPAVGVGDYAEDC